MKTKVSIVLAAWILLCTPWSVAQTNTTGANTRLQDTRRWQKDIDKYKDVLEKGEFPAVMEKLADSYRMIGDFEEAEDWYRKAIVSGNQSPSARLNYARTLQTNGKYAEAKSQFILYEEVTGEYEIGEKYIASCDMAMRVRDEEDRYEIRPVTELNTKQSDIVTFDGRRRVYFATRAKKKEIGTSKAGKNSNGDYDIYTSMKDRKGFISEVKRIRGKANSRRYDEINAIQMPGSDLLLFTRIGEQAKGKSIKTEVTSETVTIRGGVKKNYRKWRELDNLPYNLTDGYANFHPAIHPSGDVIIFASDRPGGYGGVDLYMVRRTGGKWSEPRNLGPEVNTEGDELFPSFNEQGYLFFASDGHIGHGGLDVYTADLRRGRYVNVQNMGTGINSSMDDFGVVWDRKTSTGYFNSNRNGKTGDDIYYFRRTPGVSGTVHTAGDKKPLPGSIVRLKDIAGNERIIITDGGGNFSEPVKINTGYLMTVDAPGYSTYRDTIWTKNIPQGRDVSLDIYLKPEQNFRMAGRVVDYDSNFVLPNSNIRITSKGKDVNRINVSSDSADYSLQLSAGGDYSVFFERDGYVPKVKNIATKGIRGTVRRRQEIPMLKGDYAIIHGEVREEEGENKALSSAVIAIIDNNTNTIIDSSITLSDGSFYIAVPLDSNTTYSIVTARKGYFATSMDIKTDSVAPGSEMTLSLGLPEARFGLNFTAKTINYGYNQANTDPISDKDLNELYFFLLANPDAILEVRSHTDSRGQKEYNLELSRQRSESVIQYILANRPASEERFVSWGFGEEYILNECVDGVQCDEERHAVNRRTEIKLVER